MADVPTAGDGDKRPADQTNLFPDDRFFDNKYNEVPDRADTQTAFFNDAYQVNRPENHRHSEQFQDGRGYSQIPDVQGQGNLVIINNYYCDHNARQYRPQQPWEQSGVRALNDQAYQFRDAQAAFNNFINVQAGFDQRYTQPGWHQGDHRGNRGTMVRVGHEPFYSGGVVFDDCFGTGRDSGYNRDYGRNRDYGYRPPMRNGQYDYSDWYGSRGRQVPYGRGSGVEVVLQGNGNQQVDVRERNSEIYGGSDGYRVTQSDRDVRARNGGRGYGYDYPPNAGRNDVDDFFHVLERASDVGLPILDRIFAHDAARRASRDGGYRYSPQSSQRPYYDGNTDYYRQQQQQRFQQEYQLRAQRARGNR